MSDFSSSEIPNRSDTISRQAALEGIQGFYPPKVANETEAEAINRVGWECAINCMEAYLRTVKPIDPVKHGKWMEIKDRLWWKNYYCSECRTEFMVDTCMLKPMWKFCPECGARMDG